MDGGSGPITHMGREEEEEEEGAQNIFGFLNLNLFSISHGRNSSDD